MNHTIRICCALLTAVVLAMPARAQEEHEGHPAVSAFEPLDLPTPNQYRSASGKPGPAYWQQRADYTIHVALDPSTNRVSGSETITYTNNAPQALDFLWLQLDQNLFRPGSKGSLLQGPDSRWRGAFEGGGFDIEEVQIVHDGTRYTSDLSIQDTAMRLSLAKPLAENGGKLDIVIEYGFTIPEYGADRLGWLPVEGGTVYEVAQWYPRMYVYDDVNGWNVQPYLGHGEFYLNFGTYHVEITVPREFIVVATGELLNPEDVLTAEQRQRLEHARRSTETVTIVGRDEIGMPGARPAGTGPLTWKFRAENVRDVAWAASQAFIWDAAGYEDVLVMSAYPAEGLSAPGEEPGWEASTQYSRRSIQHYSETWFPYPYPVAINVAGAVSGMEYPMVNFSGVNARGQGLFGVTDHEFGHNWFPMIVAGDERRYPWMDEGFNQFINHYSKLAFYGDRANVISASSNYIAATMASDLVNHPILTHPHRLPAQELYFLAYYKPAKGLLLLREHVLGPERFDAAFREYIERWAFRHPQPADFFRTVEDVSGEDLDWFWRGWFFSTDILDQAVANVSTAQERAIVTLYNREGLVMPVDMLITYRSGQTERRRVPVEAWMRGDTFEMTLPRIDVASITLDPDAVLPDVDRSNNTWQASETASPTG